jgi:hypothetical protein
MATGMYLPAVAWLTPLYLPAVAWLSACISLLLHGYLPVSPCCCMATGMYIPADAWLSACISLLLRLCTLLYLPAVALLYLLHLPLVA